MSNRPTSTRERTADVSAKNDKRKEGNKETDAKSKNVIMSIKTNILPTQAGEVPAPSKVQIQQTLSTSTLRKALVKTSRIIPTGNQKVTLQLRNLSYILHE